MMDERGIPDILRENQQEIRDRFDVQSLTVFGSAARGQETPESDVDILVAFTGGPTFDRFMDLKFYLEDLLGRRVDLVTPNALRPELATPIERESVHVA